MEELKSGKISTNQLKQILLNLDQEALKKLSEIHYNRKMNLMVMVLAVTVVILIQIPK